MMRPERPKKLTTLEEFIITTQARFPEASGDLSQLLRDISLAGKIVSQEINRTIIRDATNPEGKKEAPEERMQRLEEFASTQYSFALNRSGIVCLVVSEESNNPIQIDPNGKYVVVLDPLDGTFNVEVNASIGTLFSVYKRVSPIGTEPTEEDAMQTGTNQVAAGYLLYGTSIVLVFTTRAFGVNAFTLDEELGEFFLALERIKIPQKGSTFSINTSYYKGWSESVKKYYHFIRGEEGNKSYTYRYIGSLVADVHRTLLDGGIFMFPANHIFPNGKLKLMYQCNPISFLVEQAGGRSSADGKRILNIKPESIHQYTPVMLGSTQDVLEAERILV